MTNQESENIPIGQALLSKKDFHSTFLKRCALFYQRFFDSYLPIIILLLVGLIRMGLFLWSYAPADGADALDYYTYAAYIAGNDLPDRAANVSPIYPLFIYINYYVFNNFNLIIIFQLLMSSSLGLIMYYGLQQYNKIFAFLVALVVLGDAQIGVLFNFTSTEPVYIFLLCLTFSIAAAAPVKLAGNWRSVTLGIFLVLLRETRTVGRFLFFPIIILYGIKTRNLKQTFLAIASILFTALLFNTIMLATGVQQTSVTNTAMYSRPLIEFNLLREEAGEVSQNLEELVTTCHSDYSELPLNSCIETILGIDENEVGNIYRQAYWETIYAFPGAVLSQMRTALYNFLRSSGQQYQGNPTPAEVQCDNITDRSTRSADVILNQEWAALSLTNTQINTYENIVHDFVMKMCPPWPENHAAQRITDYLAKQYSFLSHPFPYVWNITLLLLIIVFPWARQFWYPFFLSISTWIYHASISTLLHNVQPRYVVVTNPFRSVLIVLMIVILGQLLVNLIDRFLFNKATLN